MFVLPSFSSKALFKQRLPSERCFAACLGSWVWLPRTFPSAFCLCGSFPCTPLPPDSLQSQSLSGPFSEEVVPSSKHSQAALCTLFWQTGSSKAGSGELKHHSIQLAVLCCQRVLHVPCVSLVPFLNLNVAVDLYSGPKLQTRA